MPNDASAPATKKDIKIIKAHLASHDEQFIKVLEFIKSESGETRKYIDEKHEETMRHFDVVAENMHHDLAGAHHEEIEVLKDRSKNHESRIRHLELRPV